MRTKLVALTLILITALPCFAQTISGGDIKILPAAPGTSGQTISNTGGNIVINSSVGDPSAGPVSNITPGGVQLKPGHVGQLYDIRSLAFSANPNPVAEGQATQLAPGVAILDDDTSLVLQPVDILWNVIRGPVTGIDPTGVATAGMVAADTRATIEGAVLNFSDQFVVTVSDGLSEFEQWQILHFGSTDAREAQPDKDPDGDGFDNEFEFTAGLIPTDPTSRFHLDIDHVPGQPDHRNLVFSPRLRDRSYRVLRSPDIATTPFVPLTGELTSDNGAERTVTDTTAAAGRRYYVVEVTKP